MRVLLADDQKEVRSALKILLEHEENIEIVAEACDMSGLLIKAKNSAPDLVLLDWELGNVNVQEFIPLLRQLFPVMKIIAMSCAPEARNAAVKAGVDAFVSKGQQSEVLLNTLRTYK